MLYEAEQFGSRKPWLRQTTGTSILAVSSGATLKKPPPPPPPAPPPPLPPPTLCCWPPPELPLWLLLLERLPPPPPRLPPPPPPNCANTGDAGEGFGHVQAEGLVGVVLDQDARVMIAFGDEFDFDLVVVNGLEQVGALRRRLLVGGHSQLGEQSDGS